MVGHSLGRVRTLKGTECLLLPDVIHSNTPMKVHKAEIEQDVFRLGIRWRLRNCQPHKKIRGCSGKSRCWRSSVLRDIARRCGHTRRIVPLATRSLTDLVRLIVP